jgi:3-oxoacyl-[acyl-carrier protein] reductase
MSLQGARCVVTGGTEGIGLALARAFQARGAQVAICARTAANVDRVAKELGVVGLRCDVSQEEDVSRFAAQVQERLGAPDIVVNNAGLGHFAPIEELTLAQFDDIMAVNVRGMFLVTRAFLAGMRRRGSGDIVNIASLAGRNGFVGGTAYTASKHAVLGFSKSLMLEVRKANIRVIAVCPGSVETPFFEKSGYPRPDPGKVLSADDVARAVVAALELPGRAMVSELDIRPTNP